MPNGQVVSSAKAVDRIVDRQVNSLEFRNVTFPELNTVCALYKESIDDPFCTWNEFYPGMEEIEWDFRENCLYVLEEDGKILGALSVVPENEMDDFACWRIRDHVREIARVVVARDARGRGLSRFMVEAIAAKLQVQGCRAIHLAAAKVNLPALKCYGGAGFQTMGEDDMYGNRYFLMERTL